MSWVPPGLGRSSAWSARPPFAPHAPSRAIRDVLLAPSLAVLAILLSACGGSPDWLGEQGSGVRKPAEYVGLHVTEQELALWRHRAVHGPYRVKGDVSAHSPGDWSSIANNADRFLADPDYRRWSGNTTGSCYDWGDPAPDTQVSRYLKDAAFVALVKGDASYRDAAAKELLAIAGQPGLDFTDASRWCVGELSDGNPMLEIGNWLSHLLIAYDYLGDDAFSDAERSKLDAWFLGAGHFFKDEVHHALTKNFEDRLADDYRLTWYAESVNASPMATSHYGGHDLYSLQFFYNNRRATSARFFGLVGVKFEDEELTSHARRFVREFIAYSTFEDGIVGDFERWKDSHPDLGWDYSAAVLSSVITIADAFARAGDPSLYRYSTTEGAYGTESSTPKSLLTAIRNHQSYLLPDVKRYGTDDPAKVGQEAYRIDGVHAAIGWYSVADIVLVPANAWYRDAKVRRIYTRTESGTDPYPEKPASRGHAPAWTGDWGLYPGVLFMYGQTEGVVDPFATFR